MRLIFCHVGNNGLFTRGIPPPQANYMWEFACASVQPQGTLFLNINLAATIAYCAGPTLQIRMGQQIVYFVNVLSCKHF